MWLNPSFEPIVATTSWSGSRRRRIAIRSAGRPRGAGCRCRSRRCSGGCASRGRPRRACRSTHSSGGSVGLPIPRSITSIPVAPLAVLQLVDPAEEIRRQVADPGRDLEVVPLDRLVFLGTRIGLGLDHDHVSRRTTGVPRRRRTDPRRSVRHRDVSLPRIGPGVSAPSSIIEHPASHRHITPGADRVRNPRRRGDVEV